MLGHFFLTHLKICFAYLYRILQMIKFLDLFLFLQWMNCNIWYFLFSVKFRNRSFLYSFSLHTMIWPLRVWPCMRGACCADTYGDTYAHRSLLLCELGSVLATALSIFCQLYRSVSACVWVLLLLGSSWSLGLSGWHFNGCRINIIAH